jgi:hypothetical protein
LDEVSSNLTSIAVDENSGEVYFESALNLNKIKADK